MLGLGSAISRSGKLGPSIIRDGLVLRHDYNAGAVEPCSTGAASFNGTSDHIDVGDSNNFVTGNNVTMACWFRLLDDDGGQYLISNQRSSGGSNISIRLNSNSAVTTAGYVSLLLWSGSNVGYVNYDGNVDTSNQWHHIAVTTTSGAQKIYLDGIDVASGTLTFANAASTDHTTLGAHNLSSAGDFKGYMANVGVWDAVLTQPQIKSIMNKDYAALSASEKADLVSWWNLDSTIPDAATLVYDNHHGGGEILGDELVNCFSFDCDNPATAWGEGSGWSFSGGKAIYDGTGGTSPLAQSDVIEEGKQYKVTVEVLSNEGSGANTLYLGGTILSAVNLSVGTHVFYGETSNSSVVLTIYGRSGEVFEIGSISVKQVNGNTGTLA